MADEPSEKDMVDKHFTDMLYTHEFKNGAGKYFTIVSKDANDVPDAVDIEHPQRGVVRNKIKTTFTFIKEHGEIKSISLKRFKYYKKKEWVEQEEQIVFSFAFFKQIIGYLQMLSKLNLSDIDQRRIALADDALPTLDDETKKKLRTLLMRKDGQAIIEELINSGVITSTDIVNIGYRKKQLEVFERLLNETGYVDIYKRENTLIKQGHEVAWQHFFSSNDWIFGYGLDYRFLGILQREATIGVPDVGGQDAVINDFLLGCSKFTVVVEVKTPETPLFGKDKNRSNAWTLSGDLISSFSQILEQKASWQVLSESNSSGNFDDEGIPIKQKTVDPKSILIIGTSSQFQGDEKENQIKAKTFELFRRDSRNVEVMTYDELYERTKFIVEHKKKTGA